MRLRTAWTATCGVDPARQLAAVARPWSVYVLPDLGAVGGFLDRPWWRLSGLLDANSPALVLVWREDTDFVVRTPGLTVAPLATAGAIPTPTVEIAGAAGDGITRPDLLCPTTVTGPSAITHSITARLWALCAASSWARIATTVTPDDTARSARLEFFGLQRVTHPMPAGGPTNLTDAQLRAAFELWRWAEAAGGPDRLLAARQVISLYRTPAPWGLADDIRQAAEPIFLALRGDAIGEGFKVQREGRERALDVARQTAESTTSLAKGAAERCLAALVALGGIIVAKTNKTLTASQAGHLRVLLAAFLFALAAWSVVIEGPAVELASRGFKDDIAKLSPLLPDDEQKAILGLSSLRRAGRQVRRVRLAVPVVYVVAAVIALVVH